MLVFLFGVFFGAVESAYFGWNKWPQSEAELICDGIAILIMSIGLNGFLNRREKRRK